MELNLPVINFDSQGKLYMTWRAYLPQSKKWEVFIARYELASNQWSTASEVSSSSFCQDRRALLKKSDNELWMCWPADLRKNNKGNRAGVHLTQLSQVDWGASLPEVTEAAVIKKPLAYQNQPSPARPRNEHNVWKIGNKKLTLLFGDFHRHTDFSNCLTGGDGCLVDQYRYAYDIAALDFLGPTDHTDIGKVYTPYEWWQTQGAADVFMAPGLFTSMYAYEREQYWPWGHRNVIFVERNGPIVYIHKNNYHNSQWSSLYPLKSLANKNDKSKKNEITPMEMWDILEQYGKPVAVISHTGASRMGTDWDEYKESGINNNIENTVEIFQGARVSYEGLGAPQPTVGLRVGERNAARGVIQKITAPADKPIKDFDKSNNGVYQNALANNLKLGVFASSDHIAQHTAFGGVYVEEVSRKGIIEALRLRRSIAATDKIFIEFSCNDHLMGEVFECEGKPELSFMVDGTGPIERITLVRNEQNYKSWEPQKKHFERVYVDSTPLAGENRYYLRVEQNDGNMAWGSPVWVRVKAAIKKVN